MIIVLSGKASKVHGDAIALAGSKIFWIVVQGAFVNPVVETIANNLVDLGKRRGSCTFGKVCAGLRVNFVPVSSTHITHYVIYVFDAEVSLNDPLGVAER